MLKIVYDNTKVVVTKFVGKSQRQATNELLKLSIYYGFSFRFTNIAKPNENSLALSTGIYNPQDLQKTLVISRVFA